MKIIDINHRVKSLNAKQYFVIVATSVGDRLLLIGIKIADGRFVDC